MPKIGEELDAVSSITWVGTSFLIAYTAFLLVNGRLSDIFGRKGCLLLSLALLGVGDLLCGFARSAVMLFVFRAVSGVGAGGVNSLVMVVVSDITTLKERGKYQGYLEIMIALGNGLGPLIGGAFSENVSWRWTFWLVVPLAGVAAGVVTLLLPQTKVEGDWRTKIAQIDYFGVFAGMGTVLLLLVCLMAFLLSRRFADGCADSNQRWRKHLCVEFGPRRVDAHSRRCPGRGLCAR